MIKKIYIIWSDYKWEEERLEQEAKYLWYKVKFLPLEQIAFKLWNSTEIFFEWKNILSEIDENSIFIIRRSRWQVEKLIALVYYFDKKLIKYTDSFESISTNLSKKRSMISIESKIIPHPPWTTFINKLNYKNIDKKTIKFPCIIKPINWRHWEWVELIKDYKELEDMIWKTQEIHILQGFIDIEAEYRIFIIKWESIWVIQKIPEEWSLIANYKAGARFIKSNLENKLINESIKICNEQKIDIWWVDIVKSKEWKYYILEINRCPEFKAFTQATWINIAKEIILRI